jgi:hypothetical protein
MVMDKKPKKRGISNLYSDGATIQLWREGKLFREKHIIMASDAPEISRQFVKTNLVYLMGKEWECYILIKHK